MSLAGGQITYGSFRLFIPRDGVEIVEEHNAAVWNIGILNEWSNDGNRPGLLCNGDMLVIYAENAARIQKEELQYRRDLYEFNKKRYAQRKELHDDLFGDWDVMSMSAEITLRDDPAYFLEVGFPKVNKIPPDWRSPEKQTTFEKFLRNDPKTFIPPTYDENALIAGAVRDDVIYAGIIDLDNEVYGVVEDFGDNREMFFFKGLQKGFDPLDWGLLLKRGHKTLVMRSENALA